jgi:hypothetical protein
MIPIEKTSKAPVNELLAVVYLTRMPVLSSRKPQNSMASYCSRETVNGNKPISASWINLLLNKLFD